MLDVPDVLSGSHSPTRNINTSLEAAVFKIKTSTMQNIHLNTVRVYLMMQDSFLHNIVDQVPKVNTTVKQTK